MSEMLLNLAYLIKLSIKQVGDFSTLVFRALFRFPAKLRSLRSLEDTVEYLDAIGWGSAAVVIFAGFFVGAIVANQAMAEMRLFGAEGLVGRVTGALIVRELGPILTAMLVSSRICSGTASELGSMKVSQQLNALITLGVDPVEKLVSPRILAAMIAFPLLTILNDAVSILSGWLFLTSATGDSLPEFLSQALDGLKPVDLVSGTLKPALYGALTMAGACYYGLNVTGGASGVRRATTSSVVLASLFILGGDFLITRFIVKNFFN